jgi:hypothetical protein
MLELIVKQKEIEIANLDVILRGTVGAKCKIKFENFWNEYNKTIVFKRVSSGCSKPFKVIINSMESTIEIPWEILVESGAFQIGAYGVTENEVLPTLWSEEIKIEYATDTNGETPKSYSLNEIEQLKLQKQDKLIPGANIIIEDNVISASGGGGSGGIVDQTYNPKSPNAQSGKAVAEAIANIEIPDVNDITVDQSYNEESENPQSGIAVAEALEGKMDRFGVAGMLPRPEGDDRFGYEFIRVAPIADRCDIDNPIGELRLKGGPDLEGVIILGGNYSSNVMLGTDESPQTVGGIATPTLDNQATNKKYVDDTIADTVGDIETALDGIIAIQNSLIGGGNV